MTDHAECDHGPCVEIAAIAGDISAALRALELGLHETVKRDLEAIADRLGGSR
jgi:hypothetical protein